MFDKFISIPFENLSTVDDLMLTLSRSEISFSANHFRPNIWMCQANVTFLNVFWLNPVLHSDFTISILPRKRHNRAVLLVIKRVRYRYNFRKNDFKFCLFFSRKKSRKLVKPFEIIVIKKALLKAQFVS